MLRNFLLSFMVIGALGAMKCNGRSPLTNTFGLEVTCKSGGLVLPPQVLPIDSVTYMSMAAAGDLFEIQSAQIALIKGDAEVRSFAQMLINDHTQTTATLKAAAASSGLLAPIPILNLLQSQMIAELELASTNFNQIFWQQQMIAHRMALNLHSNYAAKGDVATLRGAASSALPIIQMHLNKVMTFWPMMGGSCPANFWCHSDFDSMGMSFDVCCPSDAALPSFSVSTPYFSASVAPIYSSLPSYYYYPLYSNVYTNPLYL